MHLGIWEFFRQKHLYANFSEMSLISVLLILQCAVFLSTAEINFPVCQNQCGNVSIPYPFGTTEECSLHDSFLVTCNTTDEGANKLYLDAIDKEITDLNVGGHVRILSSMSYSCFNSTGREDEEEYTLDPGKYQVSKTLNKLTAVGCDSHTLVGSSEGNNYTTGCLSLCSNIANVINGSCSGVGCCQTSIPKRAKSFYVRSGSFSNHEQVLGFNPCSYAFLVEESGYNFSSTDLLDIPKDTKFPVMLDWAIWDKNCSEGQKDQRTYACKDKNSFCDDSMGDLGYRCNCSSGYEGNPYLVNGCQDIDECKSEPCKESHMICKNSPGNYSCSCDEGSYGDGPRNQPGCNPIPHGKKENHINSIALGISITISMLLLGGSWILWVYRRMKIIKLREHFFEQNGGIMLQRQLSKHHGSVQSAKIFREDDLRRATNNFHCSRILGYGGQGTVYKGILPDKTAVAIKKSIIGDQSQIEPFINEVIILSQVNHKNVVKILGCCLETEIPLLVYEFVTNGTLYDHLHGKGHRQSAITWENRLRMASEAASAFSYLHSAASTPIIHRDVKTTNILLDENYTAKVSDFGASRLVPADQTQLTTMVQGTFGYLDPEYFHTSRLTEKSDVYSFGVVLVELLTGMKALCFERPQEERSLINYFSSSMRNNNLDEIVDRQVTGEAKTGQIKEFAILAKRCLKAKGEERPCMKEVAMELERLRMMGKHPWINQSADSKESDYFLAVFSDMADSATDIHDDSMEIRLITAI